MRRGEGEGQPRHQRQQTEAQPVVVRQRESLGVEKGNHTKRYPHAMTTKVEKMGR